MKHYKDTNNNIYAYESDGSQDEFIPDNLTQITDDEAFTILNPIGDTKEAKYAEIYAHADSLIAEQEAAFFTKGVSTGRNKDRLLKQQNKRNNKKIKGQNLNAKEQAEDDRYDSFMDWADIVYDVADTSEDAVEAMTNVEDVKNYDVDNITWPTWNN